MKTINERVLEDFDSDESLKPFLFPNIDNDIKLSEKFNNIDLKQKVYEIDLNNDIMNELLENVNQKLVVMKNIIKFINEHYNDIQQILVPPEMIGYFELSEF
nr:hypothetical protein [Bacteroidales bacterium]